MSDPAPAAHRAPAITTGAEQPAGTPADDLFHRDALAFAKQSAVRQALDLTSDSRS